MAPRGRAVALLAAAALAGFARAQLAPPTNVSIATDAGSYYWQNGYLSVSWLPPAYPVSNYMVSVSPLDFTHTFDASTAGSQDWIFDPPAAASVMSGQLALAFTLADSTNVTVGRGTAPFAYRRIPDSGIGGRTDAISWMQVDVDCSSAPPVMAGSAAQVACGIVVYDAGANLPLLTWSVIRGAPGTPTVIRADGYNGAPIANATLMADASGTAWPDSGAGIQLYLRRNAAADPPFTMAARLIGDATPWSALPATVMRSAFKAALNSFAPGALWFGVAGKGSGWGDASSPAPSGLAQFDNFRFALSVPSLPPTDLYGAADVCYVGPPAIANASITVPGTNHSALLRGLHANFPYTVAVYAQEAATGVWSAPSAPIMGTYLWARRMPPRQQALSLFLDSRWMPGTRINNWPDASGRGHAMLGRAAATQPTGIRASGYGGEFLTPGYVRFTRSAGTFLVGDADGIDLGVGGEMTGYWVARNRETATQIYMGRGTMAATMDYSPGWMLAVSSIATDTLSGFLSLRANDDAGTIAGGQVRNVIQNTWGYQTSTPLAFGVVRNPAAPPMAGSLGGAHTLYACNEPTCTNGEPKIFEDPNNASYPGTATIGSKVSVQYSRDPAGGVALARPPISDDLNFRIGGQPSAVGNAALAYGGDVYGIMLYREAHDSTTRGAISSWYRNYIESAYCNLNINSVGVPAAGQCTNGPIWADCYQECSSGYSYFIGSPRYHGCSNGIWNAPPLVCKRMCYDVAAPAYIQSCFRRFIDETFDASDPETAARPPSAKYITHPLIPAFERNVVWAWNGARGVMVANTATTTDACARIRSSESILGPHVTRWSLFNPPNNGLETRTSATMRLDSGASIAGVVVRLVDANQHYRAEFSAGNVTLVRISSRSGTPSFTRTVLRTVSGGNATVVPGVWYNVSVRAKRSAFTVLLNDVPIIAAVDPTNNPNYGSGGVYIGAGSMATFDAMAIDNECDLGNIARYMYEGMTVNYVCKPGYDVIGNTSMTCVDSAKQYNKAFLICKSQPPTPVPFNVSLPEHSVNLTFVGNVRAEPANIEQTLTYILVAQYPPPPPNSSGFAFSVAGCSGAVRVNDPSQLDFQVTPVFTLTVAAYPDAQTISSAFWNVTINMINVPDAPSMDDAYTAAAEAGCGPSFWNYSLPVANPDGWALSYSIIDGNTGGQFAVDPVGGFLYVACAARLCPPIIETASCPAGLNSAYSREWTLAVGFSATNAGEIKGMAGFGSVTITVIDINQAPVLPPNTLEIREDVARGGAYIGTAFCVDMDAANSTDANGNQVSNPPAWYTLTIAMPANADWNSRLSGGGSLPAVLSTSPDGSGAISFSPAVPATGFPFTPLDYILLASGRKARAVITGATLTCTDGTGLSVSNSLTVIVTALNDNYTIATIASLQTPNGGLSTAGGEIIRFLGAGFPTGGTMTLIYASPYGGNYTSPSCVIVSPTIAECRSAEGVGANLAWAVMMDGFPVQSQTNDLLSYAPPRIDGYSISSGSITTAGSSVQRNFLLTGANFGPAGTPIQIWFGADRRYQLTVAYAARPTDVSHTLVIATVGAGCGASLLISAAVAGQNSTFTGATPPRFSFPRATIGVITPPSQVSLRALSTLGGQTLRFSGSNFGPFKPEGVVVSYTNENNAGAFTYSITCRQVPATPHSAMDCPTAAGVGARLAFAANICEQASFTYLSSSAATTVSYAPPVITDIAGPGSSRASTEGGQVVRLLGSGFGPVSVANQNPNPITRAVYGRNGRAYNFTGVNCYVSTATPSLHEVTCLTSPGSGTGLLWQLTIGGQVSNYAPRLANYAPPVVSSFSGPGASQADTRAGPAYNVTVNGLNFGFDMSLLAVVYIDTLTGARATDGVVPGAPAGRVEYTPLVCTYATLHRALQCTMPPGAGSEIIWKVTVDGQVSTDPVTDFAPPTVGAVYLTASGGAVISPDGGDSIDIVGTNFGPANLVQNVTYGPGGVEYALTSWSWVSHSLIRATTLPGIGAGLKFTVVVADQSSGATQTTLSYRAPTVLSVSPNRGPTVYDAARPRTITVTAVDVGLLNPDVDVQIAVGNYNDTAVYRLPIITRVPSLAQVKDPAFARPPSPVLYTLTFAMPETLGLNRTIRVLPFLRSAPLTDEQVAAAQPQSMMPWLAHFSFEDPYLSFVAVRRLVSDDECSDALPRFTATLSANPGTNANCSNLRVLEINGNSLGPAASVTGDSIGRRIQFQPNLPGISVWLDGFIAPFNWSHTKVYAYALVDKGAIRVAIDSHTWEGALQTQSSNARSYADVSPRISGIIGQPTGGYRTEGWQQLQVNGEAAETMTISVGELYGFNELYINVGLPPFVSNCTTVNAQGQIVPPNRVFSDIVFPQTNGDGRTAAITCMVGAGQSRGQIVQVIKDGVPSLTDVRIDYASPTVTGTVYNPGWAPGPGRRLAGAPWPPFNPFPGANMSGFIVPTTGARIRLQGSNFGPCPSALFVRLGLTSVDYCIQGTDAVTGEPRYTLNPAVAVSYDSALHLYTLEVTVPDGEGYGWMVDVTGGDTSSADTATSVPLSYLPPTVTAIAPGSGPTVGSTPANPITLVISGANFGTGNSATSVRLVSPWRASALICTQVRVLSHAAINCTLPPGTGYELAAEVTVASQRGAGGTFSYAAPSTSQITLINPSTIIRSNGSAPFDWITYWRNLVIPAGAPNSVTPAVAAAGGPLPTWSATGGAIVVADGSNYGPGVQDICPVAGGDPACASFAVDNCAVVTEPAVAQPPSGAAPRFRCDNAESFLGEGEVAQGRELFWSDTRVVFYLPAGAGPRNIMVVPGGQPPAAAAERMPNFAYAPPALNTFARPQGPVSTEGGGRMDVLGASFVPWPANYFINASAGGNGGLQNISFPYPLPLPGPYLNVPAFNASAAGAPTAADFLPGASFFRRLDRTRIFPTHNIRLVVNNGTLYASCRGTPYTADGASVAPGFEACQRGMIADVLLANDTQWNTDGQDKVSFLVPPGVGVNKTITLQILSVLTGEVVAASPTPALFSYDPPVITSITDEYNSSMIWDDGAGGTTLRIKGYNMGRLQDSLFFSPEEQLVELFVGGFIEANASRRATVLDGEFIGFRLPAGAPAGYSTVKLKVAGQFAVSAPRTTASLFVGCRPGFFAHANETCAPCPLGATCAGFIRPFIFNETTGDNEFVKVFQSPPESLHPLYKFDMSQLQNHTVMASLPSGGPGGGPLRLDTEVDINGYHTYPLPTAGFFNLNSTLAGMAEICPPAIRSTVPEGRDVCVVACLPTYACVGANVCAEPYQIKAPYFRCADCAPKYFRSAGDCIKCPDSPGMLFVGFALIIIFVAVAGYFLNKYRFDIRVVSIGIDYFQVLSIFANSKVTWPPVVRELYRLLSAFNLNIEIVAPECLIPDVSFEQKFAVMLSLPFVLLLVFTLWSAGRLVFLRFCYKQRRWRDHLRSMAPSISVLLLLIFLLYLQLCKVILSVFECLPTTPPDGKLYLQAVFEECGKPGGVQLRLIPWSIVGIFFVIIGYPLFVGLMNWRNRETVMEDQLLLALEMAPPAASWTAIMRAMMGRTYYQFKPQFAPYWIQVIIQRKFWLAFAALLFSRNPAFQMAFCVLVLFIAFALQVRYKPFMPHSEFSDVLEDAARRARTDLLYASLRQRLLTVDAQAKKVTRRNALVGSGVAVVALSKVYDFLMNYNSVEAFLLFSAAMVSLMGVMYQAASAQMSGFNEAYYEQARNSITVALILLVSVSIIYYVVVLILDLLRQYRVKREAWYVEEAARQKELARGTGLGRGRRRSSGKRKADIEVFKDGSEKKAEESTTNPLFMTGAGAGDIKAAVAESLESQVDPPDKAVWGVFRTAYADMTTQVGDLNEQLTAQRLEVRKLAQALQDAGLMDEDGKLVRAGGAQRAGPRVPGRGLEKRTFGPQQSGDLASPGGGGGGGGPASPRSVAGAGGGGGGEMEMTALGGGAGVTVGDAGNASARTLAAASSYRRLNPLARGGGGSDRSLASSVVGAAPTSSDIADAARSVLKQAATATSSRGFGALQSRSGRARVSMVPEGGLSGGGERDDDDDDDDKDESRSSSDRASIASTLPPPPRRTFGFGSDSAATSAAPSLAPSARPSMALPPPPASPAPAPALTATERLRMAAANFAAASAASGGEREGTGEGEGDAVTILRAQSGSTDPGSTE